MVLGEQWIIGIHRHAQQFVELIDTNYRESDYENAVTHRRSMAVGSCQELRQEYTLAKSPQVRRSHTPWESPNNANLYVLRVHCLKKQIASHSWWNTSNIKEICLIWRKFNFSFNLPFFSF